MSNVWNSDSKIKSTKVRINGISRTYVKCAKAQCLRASRVVRHEAQISRCKFQLVAGRFVSLPHTEAHSVAGTVWRGYIHSYRARRFDIWRPILKRVASRSSMRDLFLRAFPPPDSSWNSTLRAKLIQVLKEHPHSMRSARTTTEISPLTSECTLHYLSVLS